VNVEIRRLREADVRSLVEELWLPFAREMAEIADRNALADDADLVEANVAHREERLDDGDATTWIAVDGGLVGYASARIETPPPVFRAGDRLHLGELYVREPRRGEGVASALVDRVRAAAAERGCERVTLDVDVENESARGFYEARGFEPARIRLAVDPASDGQ
jgi:ribosomal protein S18 acetylase RimI-like enzyme